MAQKETTSAPSAPSEPSAPVTSIEPRFDNREAIQYEDNPQIYSERGNVADGETRERAITPLRDALWVSHERRKAWGIEGALLTSEVDAAHQRGIGLPGEKVLITLRDSEMYTMETDRYWDKKEEYPSITPVMLGGRQAAFRDNKYYVVDRAEYERMQNIHDNAALDNKRNIDKQELRTAEGGMIRGFDANKEESVQSEYDRAHGLLNNPGFSTPYPAGMSYEDILRYNGVDKTREIEVRAASGGRNADVSKYNQFMEERAKEQKSRAKNRKYSFSGSPTK